MLHRPASPKPGPLSRIAPPTREPNCSASRSAGTSRMFSTAAGRSRVATENPPTRGLPPNRTPPPMIGKSPPAFKLGRLLQVSERSSPPTHAPPDGGLGPGLSTEDDTDRTDRVGADQAVILDPRPMPRHSSPQRPSTPKSPKIRVAPPKS